MMQDNQQIMAITGAGRLGLALARWAALHGISVRVVTRGAGQSRKAALDLAAQEGGIEVFDDLKNALCGAHIVFEALPEDLAQKAAHWALVQQFCPSGALYLTGSSSISLASIKSAADISLPLLGFHLFLPIDRMRAVEIVTELGAPKMDVEAAMCLANRLEKIPIHVKDRPGYAATRMALAIGLEAMRLVESGTADATCLDLLMKHGYGHPCGPLELSDRVGLDLRLAIARQLFVETGVEAYRPPAILESKVAKGEIGRRSGCGFYRWEDGKKV